MEEKDKKNSNEYYTIDIMHIFKSLWKKAWLIAIIGILAGALGFSVAAFAIEPDYSSAVKLYVNNSSINLGNTSFSISASDISASQSLVKTYTELLKNRTTLERIIEKTGVPYTYEQLYDMISAGSSNDTEVMQVTVVSKNPYEAAEIANCIAEVLPIRIAEIIEGASMEVVDSAVPNLQKISPSITKYTAIAMILGVVVICAILAVLAILDDTIRDENYVLQTYNYPILAKIPNLMDNDSKHGYYYYYQKKTEDKE